LLPILSSMYQDWVQWFSLERIWVCQDFQLVLNETRFEPTSFHDSFALSLIKFLKCFWCALLILIPIRMKYGTLHVSLAIWWDWNPLSLFSVSPNVFVFWIVFQSNHFSHKWWQSCCQFHQHSMYSFYACISQKRKKYS